MFRMSTPKLAFLLRKSYQFNKSIRTADGSSDSVRMSTVSHCTPTRLRYTCVETNRSYLCSVYYVIFVK